MFIEVVTEYKYKPSSIKSFSITIQKASAMTADGFKEGKQRRKLHSSKVQIKTKRKNFTKK